MRYRRYISGRDCQRKRMAFRSSKSKSEPWQSTGYTPGLQFRWINEQDRQRDPSSHLRTLVRSNARKNHHLKQKILKSTNTSSMHFRRLEIMPESTAVKAPNVELDPSAHLRNSGNSSVMENAMPSIGSREDGTQRLETYESTLLHLIDCAHSSSQSSVPVTTNHDGQSRQLCKRSSWTEVHERQVHGYPKSQAQNQLSRQPPGAGWQHLRQQRASPHMVLGQGKFDPFDSFPIKMQTHTHNLVAYYTAICAFAWPKEVDGLTHSHTKWVPTCMQNQMAFKSMLLAAETSYRGILGEDPWTSFAITLLFDCTKLLSEDIDNPKREISDMMIATVINIGMIELAWGDQAKYLNHMRGLAEMVRIRGGLKTSNSRLSAYLKRKAIWANQVGGRFLALDSDEESPLHDSQEHQDPSGTQQNIPCSRLISQKLVEILKSIRFLTVAQPAINTVTSDTTSDDYRATCLGIQNQLETLYLSATATALDKYCICAASSHIDHVLINTPGERLIPSKLNGEFQGLMMRSPHEVSEHDDVLRWISATAAGNISTSRAMKHAHAKASLIDKFNRALARLEDGAV